MIAVLRVGPGREQQDEDLEEDAKPVKKVKTSEVFQESPCDDVVARTIWNLVYINIIDDVIVAKTFYLLAFKFLLALSTEFVYFQEPIQSKQLGNIKRERVIYQYSRFSLRIKTRPSYYGARVYKIWFCKLNYVGGTDLLKET